MKRIVCAGLLLLAATAFVSAQVKLTFNPDKGKKYEYRTEIVQTIKQAVMGQEIPMETEMSMNYLMDIKEKTSQETKAEFAYKDIAYIISSPMMKMGCDSRTPVENPTEMDKMLGGMLGSMIGKPFEVVIAPDGSVKSVTGMDAIVEGMAGSASGGQMAAQVGAAMKQQFNDAAIKSTFEQSMKIYPVNAVKVGDSWNVEQNISISGMNSATKAKYTLKEVKKNIAVVALEATIELKPAAGMEGSLTGTMTGNMQIDTKTGLPTTSDISQIIKGSIKAQGMDVTMDIDSKIKNSISEVK